MRFGCGFLMTDADASACRVSCASPEGRGTGQCGSRETDTWRVIALCFSLSQGEMRPGLCPHAAEIPECERVGRETCGSVNLRQ